MPVATRIITDHSGRHIRIGALLGRGGEGAVHEVIGDPNLVAKIYHQPLTKERSAKIEVMARMACPDLDRFCAWPRGLLMEGTQARGLLMPRIASRKELHVLHGPKSRKSEFPDAGFEFLVHVALNVTRAYARLHADGVIVGDVNDRGIMVGADGTVRLIDCDSFQFTWQQQLFLCEVGVPEYTPPELQGQSLSGITRTESHDTFGLAVLVFRLLFMGRHPFAGVFQEGHKEIQEAIREARYAYATDDARTRMKPPPSMVAVTEGAGSTIADLFERAFSPNGIPTPGSRTQRAAPAKAPRPTSRDWAAALEALKTNLATCRFNRAHAYVRSRDACPWCELEQRCNADLFHFIPAGGDESQAIDVEAIWKALGALRAPDALQPLPEAFVAIQPAAVPSALTKLRVETSGLTAEASRARTAAAQMQADASRRRLAFGKLLAELTISSGEAADLEARLRRLEGPEHRNPATAALIAICFAMLALALKFQSVHFLAFGAVILGALYGIDAMVGRIRKWMAGRVERRLDAVRQEYLASDPALKSRYDTARQAAESSEGEALRTADVAAALEQAAAEGQSRYAVESATEIGARNLRLKAAEQRATETRAKLSAFAAEVRTLQTTIDERRARLVASSAALTSLTHQRDAEIRKLRDSDRIAQLHRFLDTQYINKANIKGITPALKSALASFGIETAADINQTAVSDVPGFGKVRSQRMMDWRNHVAKKFRYKPAQDIDPAQRRVIESKYAAGRLRIARDFVTAQTELERRIREFESRTGAAKQAADSAVRVLVQARADRRALDV